MYHRSLKRQARKLGEEGHRGWLTPEGRFFEADETPPGRIQGLTLGGHERAAVEWLEQNSPDLFRLLEDKRIAAGYECWEETDGTDMIKEFMFENGFSRVAPQ
jgi:hypothetical protein